MAPMTADPSRAGEAGRNRLARESSPYLRQHADNPVNWYPWGDEAFARARAEQKPVLLSVGYSTCHWCHVMAHESFEDPQVAERMNEWFVSIKVDREERPDVDAVYMLATQALSGHGGWPMTVFLTPERQPFYAGTYYPPEDRHGLPGFPRLLESVHTAWEERREAVLEAAGSITERMQAATRQASPGGLALEVADAERAVARLRMDYDPRWGGFGGAPKFPSPSTLEFLLAHDALGAPPSGATEPSVTEMVLHTLRRMAAGGIYDQLAGGFARYSVDERWLVPHFEKMLYDNAQLVRLYLHAYQLSGEPLFARIARETLDAMESELWLPGGGYAAALDADSEGIEGKYYVWTAVELAELLGEGSAAERLARLAYGVSDEGNFTDPHHPELTGRNVLTRARPLEEVAGELGAPTEEVARRLAELRARLLEARGRRIPPQRDDKLLASWNGLALAALAEAARVLGEPGDLERAEQLAALLWEELRDGERLLHVRRGAGAERAAVEGMLEDYAYVGLGLVELYRAGGDLMQLARAEELGDCLVELFHDAETGGFFDTAADAERLILRQKTTSDQATPAGNGAAAQLLAWLARYRESPEGERAAREQLAGEAVALAQAQMVEHAGGYGSAWLARALLAAPRREVAIVGEPAARAPLERELARRFLPATVIAPASSVAVGSGGLPLLDGRDVAHGAAAYVCESMVCELPVTTPEALAAQLDRQDDRRGARP
jgi:uncharacterized protein YyaL (SSP411 family)